MSSYTSFAVFGAGRVGTPILNLLAAIPNLIVVLLGRPGSKSFESLPPGVKAAPVDTTDAGAVAAVLKAYKVDVVISAVSTKALAAQGPIADAAKDAGVKLFVPSEYGLPTDGQTVGPLGEKNKIAQKLKALGVPSLRIHTGPLMDLLPAIFGYPYSNKISVIGDGENEISYTSIADTTGFLVHVLTTLPPSLLENKIFRLQGDRIKANDLGALFNTTVEHVDEIPGPMGAETKAFMLVANQGPGSTGWDGLTGKEGTGENAAGSANGLWAGHHWTTIKELFDL
uniref:NmrA-like domain-containing protein n=1 Tax=Mycena chlorophos TaxID=658473 RepID=A0ABQ0MEE6_MYCCL|nr:predicted protein [Mycena chlorophos]